MVDTGGWYKLCCPTSQLWKPEELGAIYRVKRVGATPPVDPRGNTLDWASASPATLSGRLDDSRPAVRDRSMAELAKRGPKAIAELERVVRDHPTARTRTLAVWTLARIDSPSARAAVPRALDDRDETTRQAALQVVSLHRDARAVPRLIELLEAPSAMNARVAAEALGRIGDARAVPALLDALKRADAGDRFLNHALTYALIEIDNPDATARGLESSSSQVRRGALVALDRMEHGHLAPGKVAPLLESTDPLMRPTAFWIAERHPEWAAALVEPIQRGLASGAAEWEPLLAALAVEPAVQDLLAARLSDRSAGATSRLLALEAMTNANIKPAPASWLTSLAQVLAGDDDGKLIRPALAAARGLAWNPEKDSGLGAGAPRGPIARTPRPRYASKPWPRCMKGRAV